jgi:ketosteroid isomerase-like protein
MVKLIREWLDAVSSGPAEAWAAYATDDVVIRATNDPELVVTTARPEAVFASGQHVS